MSKVKTIKLALRVGHPNTFRQTVNVGTPESPNRVQLVFEPGVDREVTQAEIDGGLRPFIESGLLVDPLRDPKGRQRRPKAASGDANKIIAKLEARIEELSAENSRLKAEAENR